MVKKRKPLTDKEIGQRMRAARMRVGMSQQHIALAMTMVHDDDPSNARREAGGENRWRWHQTVVGKVESGERALKLTEAVAVADIIGIPLADLVSEEPTRLQRNTAIVELAVLAEQIGKRIEELRAS